MIWLGIETTNTPLSIALVRDGKTVVEIVQHIRLTHSAGAMPAIEEVCQKASIQPKDIDAIAVSEGPGSYTGVRIGVTIAKTLAWTLHKPLVGVSSLQTLASNGRLFDGVICPLIDARRNHVYAAVYEGKTLQPILEDCHSVIDELLAQLKMMEKKVLFIGEDVSLYAEKIVKMLGDRAQIAPASINLPRASELVACAMKKEPLKSNVHAFVPQYKRIAEAEANWLKEQKANG